MFDTLERLILLQIGAAAVTRERVQDAVNRLIEQGRIEREEGRAMAEEVLTRARERSTGARSLIGTSLQHSLRGVGVPTREDYEDLLFRIEQLEYRVRLLEQRPETSAESSASPTGEPTSPESPVGGANVAPQPPRDDSDS